jgi:hypothetical protein
MSSMMIQSGMTTISHLAGVGSTNLNRLKKLYYKVSLA